MPHESSAATQFLHHRLAFDELYVRQGGDPDMSPTDINVSGAHKTLQTYDSYGAVVEACDQFAARLPADELDREDLLRRNAADRTYARLLSGEALEFTQMLNGTVGFVPEYIPETELLIMQADMSDILQELDFKVHYDAGSADEYRKWLILQDAETIKQTILDSKQLAWQAIGQYLSLPPMLKPKFVTGEPWTGWLSTTKNGRFFEKYNISPDRSNTVAAIEALVLHEQGHYVHFSTLRQHIRRGVISQGAGIIAMYSPEATQAEVFSGFAEGLPGEFAADERGVLLASFRRLYNRHLDALHQNALIDIWAGVPEQTVVQTMQGHLPFEDPERSADVVPALRDIPLFAINVAHYWRARKNADLMLDNMNTERRQQAVALLTGPFMHIDKLGSALLALSSAA